MSVNVKLKDEYGQYITYNDVESLTVPTDVEGQTATFHLNNEHPWQTKQQSWYNFVDYLDNSNETPLDTETWTNEYGEKFTLYATVSMGLVLLTPTTAVTISNNTYTTLISKDNDQYNYVICSSSTSGTPSTEYSMQPSTYDFIPKKLNKSTLEFTNIFTETTDYYTRVGGIFTFNKTINGVTTPWIVLYNGKSNINYFDGIAIFNPRTGNIDASIIRTGSIYYYTHTYTRISQFQYAFYNSNNNNCRPLVVDFEPDTPTITKFTELDSVTTSWNVNASASRETGIVLFYYHYNSSGYGGKKVIVYNVNTKAYLFQEANLSMNSMGGYSYRPANNNYYSPCYAYTDDYVYICANSTYTYASMVAINRSTLALTNLGNYGTIGTAWCQSYIACGSDGNISEIRRLWLKYNGKIYATASYSNGSKGGFIILDGTTITRKTLTTTSYYGYDLYKLGDDGILLCRGFSTIKPDPYKGTTGDYISGNPNCAYFYSFSSGNIVQITSKTVGWNIFGYKNHCLVLTSSIQVTSATTLYNDISILNTQTGAVTHVTEVSSWSAGNYNILIDPDSTYFLIGGNYGTQSTTVNISRGYILVNTVTKTYTVTDPYDDGKCPYPSGHMCTFTDIGNGHVLIHPWEGNNTTYRNNIYEYYNGVISFSQTWTDLFASYGQSYTGAFGCGKVMPLDNGDILFAFWGQVFVYHDNTYIRVTPNNTYTTGYNINTITKSFDWRDGYNGNYSSHNMPYAETDSHLYSLGAGDSYVKVFDKNARGNMANLNSYTHSLCAYGPGILYSCNTFMLIYNVSGSYYQMLLVNFLTNVTTQVLSYVTKTNLTYQETATGIYVYKTTTHNQQEFFVDFATATWTRTR